MDKRDLERLIDEVIWLKRRLQRVEHAIEPIVEAIVEHGAGRARNSPR
jgi:hypothetical protein